MVSLVILLIVFILIAVRQVGRVRFQIWQVMLLGAIAMLATLQITPLDALKAIDPDVMLFLFGIFIVGRALEDSGYLASISSRLFSRTRSLDALVLTILLVMGILSAIMMNDTLAIIGTSVVLLLAKTTQTNYKVLLLALAFAVTTGSVMSPVGNPQNLLIATHGGIENPFLTFLRYLALPTIINLFAAWGVLRLLYRQDFRRGLTAVPVIPISDPKLARISKVSLGVLSGLIMLKILFVFVLPDIDFRLTYISLAAALPIIIFSPKRFSLIKTIDWHTLIFFAAMFIVMESAWNSGLFQSFLAETTIDITSSNVIYATSVLLSQLISNVPLVALYMPLLTEAGITVRELMMLAAGSTIAGNLTILGAASNVIIIQNAEKQSGCTLTFLEFFRAGLPLTIINVTIYWLFLTYV